MGKVAINIVTGSLQETELIVGIDLGTTNSLIAVVRPDERQPITLRDTDGFALVPSLIHFDADGGMQVGNEARAFLVSDPANTVYSVKRLLGKSYKDLSENGHRLAYRIYDDQTDSLVKIQAGDQFYNPVTLSALILKALKERAEHMLKTPVTKAVITVPAYFNDTQRQATRDAGRLAGLDVLRIINEPTAAALAYGIGSAGRKDQTIAVYDLGGGTFDISILRLQEGIFEVLSTHGDTFLGGDDMDMAVVRHWMQSAPAAELPLQALRLKAEEAKKHLTANDRFTDTLDGVPLELSRTELDGLTAPLIQRTMGSCRSALADAGLDKQDIDAVIMVGGSTRVPAVKEAVSGFFGRPVHDELNPDEVVALGAAVQADILSGRNQDLLLLDVTPLSLGLETMGGLMDVIIPRNSKIPTKAGRQYTTQKDGQPDMRITVYQGERDLVQDNRKLAEFKLNGLPAMPAGLPKVDISFLLDADGILKVSAKELRSGVSQTIEVKPQYGLTDAELERMLEESITHAGEDMQQRALIEARTEARQLVDTTRGFLEKNGAYLSEEERTGTQDRIGELEAATGAGDRNRIQQLTEALNDFSRPYAERLMDTAIQKAMSGKKI